MTMKNDKNNIKPVEKTKKRITKYDRQHIKFAKDLSNVLKKMIKNVQIAYSQQEQKIFVTYKSDNEDITIMTFYKYMDKQVFLQTHQIKSINQIQHDGQRFIRQVINKQVSFSTERDRFISVYVDQVPRVAYLVFINLFIQTKNIMYIQPFTQQGLQFAQFALQFDTNYQQFIINQSISTGTINISAIMHKQMPVQWQCKYVSMIRKHFKNG